ncbi:MULTISPECIES: hypothetical protein [Arthrobacter]|uniref:Uncharacterized protein n=2 Tax=Arthrobacter TaxID=1663 RepID=A0ABU9KMN0_9MICC|nr:hypothetical protein [Arthrobacter sp. YJM1]MDP5227920.1 hypothetical protein [Arthrobacter sp. YJM1]
MYIPQELAPFAPLGMGLAVIAVLFLLFRYASFGDARGTTAATAFRHARTVGVVGWFASSLQPAMTFWQVPVRGQGPPVSPWTLFVPVILVLAVHLVGQLSYPGNRRRVRVAELHVRRMKDFLPRKLAAVTAVIFVAAAVTIVSVAGVLARPATPAVTTEAYTLPAVPGSLAGTTVAAWLGAAWLALLLGTWGVLLLITRRHPVTGPSGEENSALRTVSMNRLLRTVATIAAGLGATAWTMADVPPPGTTSYTNVGVILNLLILLLMWWWPVGKAPSHGVPSPDPALRRRRLALAPLFPLGLVMAALALLAVLNDLGSMAVAIVCAGGFAGLLWNAYCATRTPTTTPSTGTPGALALGWRTITVVAGCGALTAAALGASWLAALTPPSGTYMPEPQVPDGRALGVLTIATTGAVIVAATAVLTAAFLVRRIMAGPGSRGVEGGPAGLARTHVLRLSCWGGAVLLTVSAMALLEAVRPFRMYQTDPEGSMTYIMVDASGITSTLLMVAAILLWAFSAAASMSSAPAPRVYERHPA